MTKNNKNLLDEFFRQEYDKAVWDEKEMGEKERIQSAIYAKIKSRSNPPQLIKRYGSFYKYAAAASIAVIFLLGVLYANKTYSTKELVLNTLASPDSVVLKDGTKVYLAAHSSFKYPESFEGKNRLVTLTKGNAFFKVAKDPAHPFIVSSAAIKTKVLGTSFHISLKKEISTVTVVTGKVNVYTNKQSINLIPDEQAVFTSAGLIKRSTQDKSLYYWYNKDLKLDNVSIEKVFTVLNFKYGVCFKTEDQDILNLNMTLYLKSNLSLQNILNQINYITNLKFTKNGNTVNVSR